MKCPVCSGDVPVSAARCPVCAAQLAGAVSAVPLTSIAYEAPTALRPHDDAPTTLRGAGADPGEVTFVSPAATSAPDELPTILPDLPTPPAAGMQVGTVDGDAGPLRAGQAFGPRYHIIRPLGVGGMGAVYQAWDAELGEAVAIKVIRPEVMADPVTAREIERRFKRELQLARQVTHKNVIRIHDLGEIDGIKYITMSYVEGTDLATALRKEGPLPVARALAITRAIVSGLVEAHAAGVVHRDLKPANIMIGVDGEAYLMDFGIARSVTPTRTAAPAATGGPGTLRNTTLSSVGATMAGAIVGTVPYMAPEQAKGDEVDQRADIYALGLIVYDMLVGRRRHERAASALAELEGRIEQAPPPLKVVSPVIPDALSRIIARCLDPDPVRRYQTTQELAAALGGLDADGVPLPRIRRLTPRMTAAAALLVLAMLGGTYVVTRRALAPAAEHAPVAVVVADLQNATGDPSFDRAIEPIIKLALEEAGFISAHDRSQIRRNLGVTPPDVLDDRAARELAVQQGLGVVVAATLQRRSRGYGLTVSASEAVTGNVIAAVDDDVASKEEVLAMAARLTGDVREALGGEPSDSAQRFAMESLSATSLDVVRRYALAIEAFADGKLEEARQNFSEAVSLDPDFGLAYAGMGMMLRNLGQQQEAERYVKESLRHLDGMTERERYRTRGIFYTVTSDYQACVREYGELIARYASDAAAHNNRALCSTYLRDMSGAVAGMRRVVEILPRRALYRVNLGLYSAYSSDFAAAEQEARAAVELGSPLGYLPLAFSQLAQGQPAQAADSYRQLGASGGVGASFAASGLGDLAIHQGRFADADRILQEGAAADLAARGADRAAAKFAALAHARVARGQPGQALAAARRALEQSQAPKIRFLAARVFIEAGDAEAARPLIDSLAAEVRSEPQAYARVLRGEALIKAGDARGAIPVLTEANSLLDTWLGHFALGRAYLDADEFIRADSEFDNCLARRGEAVSLFLDEEPTYGIIPEVYYYQGQVREALQSARFADSYRTYLSLRGDAGEDPRLADVRRRIARTAGR
jgi:tetratricopeptide (TPR) repeat protein/tRNA A-37 threonylcarbamoyl transferase component Bud32